MTAATSRRYWAPFWYGTPDHSGSVRMSMAPQVDGSATVPPPSPQMVASAQSYSGHRSTPNSASERAAR